MKWLFLLSVIFLVGCNTVKQAGISAAEFVGVVDEPSLMKTPDYYSVTTIEKFYQYGSEYDIDHLDCREAVKNCQ